MPVMSDDEILNVVKQSRRIRNRPEIAVAAKG
jgi:hypothetical protein